MGKIEKRRRSTPINSTMANRSNDTNRQPQSLLVKRLGIAACVGVTIIAIVLISLSLKKVEETEYGLLYTRWTKELDDEAVSGGLFSGAPGFRFIKFPSTFVSAFV